MNENVENNKKIAKAGIGYTIGNYLIKGLSFLTIPIFTHILTTEDYGLYSTYIAYESIACSLIGLALHTSLKNAKYKYEDRYISYVSSIILLDFLSTIIWVVLVLFFSKTICIILNFNIYILVALVLHCGCSSILSIFNVHLSLTYSYKPYIFIALFNAIANIFFSIIFVFTIFEAKRYIGRIIGTLVPLVLITILIVYKVWKKSKPTFNRDYWKFGLTYSMPLIPHAISQVILNQFDRIMITRICGISNAGIYSFAYNVYTIIEVTKNSLDNVWGPLFYDKYKKKEYSYLRKSSTIYATGMLIFNIIVMLISPELIKLLGSIEYRDAIYVVIPICAAGYFSFLYTIPAQIEYYYGKTSYIAFTTAIAALVNILLNAIFIYKYGYIAAAYTTEVTYLLCFLLHFFVAKKIDGNNIFDSKIIYLLIIICALFSFISIILIEFLYIRVTIILIMLISMFFYLRENKHIV